jgi:hypothetical protein
MLGDTSAMSDHVLSIIPIDQNYIPNAAAQQIAVALLQEMLPDGEMCEAKAYDRLQFIDQGENCEAVLCPSCGKRFPIDFLTEDDPGTTWWYEVTDAISKTSPIDQLRTTMPCCGAQLPFTSLKFDWPAGFARFCLSIWNPNVDDGLLTEAQLARIELILGCKLAQIRAHY